LTRLSPEAEAQLDALTKHYEKLDRPEATINLLAAVEKAIARIQNDPSEGLNAPRPYPSLAQYGFRWIKVGSYWFAYTYTGAAITAIIYDKADIPNRLG
jgi:plasmid stabilization system protein ParE